MDWQRWEGEFVAFLQGRMAADGAHDLLHVRRVVTTAVSLAQQLHADLSVVFPAAWLHDCVVMTKDATRRAQASRLAAETAVSFLDRAAYPGNLDAIAHAIAAHSFSANIPPRTVEAQVVQDADRLDALGAIGIARTFAVGGSLARPLYAETDPFCQEREPDDGVATLDHFYTKLLRLPQTMQTVAGREEAQRRVAFMQRFLAQLAGEIGR